MELNNTAQQINKNISKLIEAVQGIFPRVTGSFTMANAASKVVTETGVRANSIILLQDTNAAAGTLQAGANRIYPSAKTAGASFTVATAGGGAAAGTETFDYIIVNPV